MDHQKVVVVEDWLGPKMVRTVRVFLGLTGYYRHFIKDYVAIAAPLARLLKKEAF